VLPFRYKKKQPESCENSIIIKTLIAEHDAVIRRFLKVRLNGNRDDTEDLLQDLYERLSKIHDLPERINGRLDTVRNYLLQIANNLVIDKYRYNGSRGDGLHSRMEDTVLFATNPSPEKVMEQKQTLKQIDLALSEIKDKYRQAFLMHRIDGKSYRQISDEIGVSVSTVEKYISAALVAIRNRV
jgi:RNA polymerase sigma-70 factor (ECF subfamily)